MIWPFAAMMTAIAHDHSEVPAHIGFLRGTLAFTLFFIPVVWVVSLVLSLLITRRPARRSDREEREPPTGVGE